MGLSTSYYTIDGEITGESSGGVRVDYLTDALGSVTAKMDQAGAVVSTARYKPFGGQLSRSGISVDPRFLYFGNSSFATLSSSSMYIHSQESSWNMTSALVSGFVASNPYELSPPAMKGGLPPGMQLDCMLRNGARVGVFPASEPTHIGCGLMGNSWVVTWNARLLADTHKTSGWIMQEINDSWGVGPNCETGEPTEVPTVPPFWEAWYVDVKVFPGYTNVSVQIGESFMPHSGNDTWYFDTPYPCTEGGESTRGWAKFYAAPKDCWKDYWHFKEGRKQGLPSLDLLSGTTAPGWSRSPSMFRYMDIVWNCCLKVCKEPCPIDKPDVDYGYVKIN